MNIPFAPFSLTYADLRETLTGLASVVKRLGPVDASRALLFATSEHLSAIRRGEGCYPEEGKRRMWLKLSFLKHVYEYTRQRDAGKAIRHFDSILRGPAMDFIGQFVPPSRDLTRDVVLHQIWPRLARDDYNVVAEACPANGDSASLRVSRCFINEVVRDIGLTHLGDRICHGDFIFWENYHPNVRFTRTKTLLRGDECCDHTLTWTE